MLYGYFNREGERGLPTAGYDWWNTTGSLYMPIAAMAELLGAADENEYPNTLESLSPDQLRDDIANLDEALILTAVDFSGRSYLGYGLSIPTEKVGSFDTELVEEFFQAFVRHADCTLHIKQLDGKNAHHIIEGTFKSVARTLKSAASINPEAPGEIPSTKGVL
jgi:imidazoleglycerol-phosphate dehydratase